MQPPAAARVGHPAARAAPPPAAHARTAAAWSRVPVSCRPGLAPWEAKTRTGMCCTGIPPPAGQARPPDRRHAAVWSMPRSLATSGRRDPARRSPCLPISFDPSRSRHTMKLAMLHGLAIRIQERDELVRVPRRHDGIFASRPVHERVLPCSLTCFGAIPPPPPQPAHARITVHNIHAHALSWCLQNCDTPRHLGTGSIRARRLAWHAQQLLQPPLASGEHA